MNTILLTTSCIILIVNVLSMQSHLSHAIPTTSGTIDTNQNAKSQQNQQKSVKDSQKQNHKDDEKSKPSESQSQTTPSFPSTRSKRESDRDYFLMNENPGGYERARDSSDIDFDGVSAYSRINSLYGDKTNDDQTDMDDLYTLASVLSGDNNNKVLDDSSGLNYPDDVPEGSWDLLLKQQLQAEELPTSDQARAARLVGLLPDEISSGEVGKRAREFFGKRSREFFGKRSREFFGKRSSEASVDKRAREFFGKRSNEASLDKRAREFFGKRSHEASVDKRAREFFGKRSPELIEKRAREFFGKRSPESTEKRAREFFGKRSQDSVDKRAREFFGKRGREFFGKRSREFFGKRSDEDRLNEIKNNLVRNVILPDIVQSNLHEKRAREIMSEKAVNSIKKRAREFFGKRARENFRERALTSNASPHELFDKGSGIDMVASKRQREFFGKRAREFFGKRAEAIVNKRAREFFGKRSGDDEMSKRQREFFGKRSGDDEISKRQREFFGKRSGDEEMSKRQREFFGKRSGDEEMSKRQREFFGKRSGYERMSKRQREFFGKRAREFFGKRAGEYFGKQSDFDNSDGEYLKRDRQYVFDDGFPTISHDVKYTTAPVVKNKDHFSFITSEPVTGYSPSVYPSLDDLQGNNLGKDIYPGEDIDHFVSQVSKRQREFFGKRSNPGIAAKRQREFFGKRGDNEKLFGDLVSNERLDQEMEIK